MQYTHCFFDLDGTVVNSAPGITHSVQYALQKMGITPPPAESLTCFIGPPLSVGFSKFCGLNPEESRLAVSYYRECYRAGAMLECTVYHGIETLLQAFANAKIPCALATCKPQIFAEQILKHFGLEQYFAVIAGADLEGVRGEKHQVISLAAQQLALSDASHALMIGDREDDVLGAKRCGMDCIGALWGFGSKDELLRAGAKAVCQTPRQLQQMLLC